MKNLAPFGKTALLPLVFFALLSPAPAADQHTAEGRKGMVVCVSPAAADLGIEVLKKGGNAVDAAVAVAFAQAVTYPAAGNIGGGGFILVYPGRGKEPVVIDYRETAPSAVNRETFARDTDWRTHRAAGVPGTVRGLGLAHQRFGKLPWKELVAPAIRLADDGFVLTCPAASMLNWGLGAFPGKNEFKRVFGKNGGQDPWEAGDRFRQPDLARTLRAIADGGPEAFYSGELADLLETEMRAGGGFITKADLAGYRAMERKPIHGTYRGYDVYGPPPPSSGGTCLVEMLNIVENFDLRKHGRYAPETCHLMAEAMRRAFCDRARFLGDPAFTTIPDRLVSKVHGRELARGIDPARATPSESLAPEVPLSREGTDTTHFSVIDADGMAVANTYTLEQSFGSGVVVKGAGYLLNNEMGDFNTRPGVTARGGRIGTAPNQVAPGKRMLSSQTPTIVARDGKPFLVTGSPGSRTIINTVFCIVVNMIDFDMDVRSAVDAPRMHHAWFPDELRLERLADRPALADALRTRGHSVRHTKQGDAHTIWVDPKTGIYRGAADRRIDGKAAGW